MRFLLVHARDRKGPLLLILAERALLPEYSGFNVDRVDTFATRDDALAEFDRLQAARPPQDRIGPCPVCGRAAIIATRPRHRGLIEYKHRDGSCGTCFKPAALEE